MFLKWWLLLLLLHYKWKITLIFVFIYARGGVATARAALGKKGENI